MTSFVMIAEGFANGQHCPHAGQYLETFDHEACGGIGYATFTTNLNAAMRFKDLAAAMAFWRKIPRNKRVREDGKPNRPLTALTVTIIKA